MRRTAFPDIEVGGQSALAIFAAMGPHRTIAEQALAKSGIWEILPERWYSLDALLHAAEVVGQTAGTNTLFAMGKRVPQNAVLPPSLDSIEAMLGSLDVTYHLNHRRGGRIMFNMDTGEMLEGIGHYRCEVQGKRRIVMTCETPYPPDLDHGIIVGFSRRFEPNAEVERDTSKPSRKHGGTSCTYIVTW